MRVIFFFGVGVFFFLSLPGCELLCQAGTGTCGMSSAERKRLLHPKAYGEYFVKSGAAREEWQRDWIACGGMASGQFTDDAPNDASIKEIMTALDKKRKILDACMLSKGYEYQRESRNSGS